ncbi:hypothetical protein HHI36_006506 [Cryptolaemus montrouzieri]|uniref:MARVEL domain-containing protein n=1 Tax=Cryptolaemus montrouzieri TaxID=559131 RepID=A0ABD2NXT7_9CUCU
MKFDNPDWNAHESVYLLHHEHQHRSGPLWSYLGLLKILEEIVNIYLIVSLVVVGLDAQAYYLFLMAMISFLVTAVFLVISLLETLIDLNPAYHWIEFSCGVASGISLGVASTVVLVALPRGYVITSMVGFLNTIIYFVDALNRYRIAVAPRRRLFWTRPVQVVYDDE